MRPVRAPVRVIIAFVACVVPCTNSSVSDRSSARERPSPSAFRRTASSTPSCSEPGVVRALDTERPPSSSATTQSMKVPPMSTPMRYLTCDLPCLSCAAGSLDGGQQIARRLVGDVERVDPGVQDGEADGVEQLLAPHAHRPPEQDVLADARARAAHDAVVQ